MGVECNRCRKDWRLFISGISGRDSQRVCGEDVNGRELEARGR